MKKVINFMVAASLVCAMMMALSIPAFAATPAASRTAIRADEIQGDFFSEKLPENPMTSEDFLSVLLYAANNDLTEVVVTYTIPYQNGMKSKLTGALMGAVNDSYKYPEYCNYLRKVSFSTVANGDNFSLVIKLADRDGDTAGMIAHRSEAIDKSAEVYNSLCKSGAIRKDMTQKDVARVLLQWVLDNTSYKDDGTRLSHTAYSVFFKGTAVCDGYASAYQLMLRQAGIKCQGRKGYFGSVCHLWTVCSLDGEVVNVDATGCEKNVDRFFAVSDKAIAKTHTW